MRISYAMRRTVLTAGVLAVLWAMPASAVREVKGVRGEDQASEADLAARRLLKRAQDLLVAQETERGIAALEALIEQYPASDVRYEAYLTLGKQYAGNFEHEQAVTYFARVKPLELREQLTPRLKDLLIESMYLMGVSFFEMRKYSSAFPVLRKITTRYPNSVWANQAYYYIGMCHFVQEHWNKAIEALSLVGTYVDPSGTAAQFVEAGRRFYLKVQDGDLPVLNRLGHKVDIRLETVGGDRETVRCVPLATGNTTFIGSIPTEMGTPVQDDNTLQVQGGDKIECVYTDVNTEEGEKDKPRRTEVKVVSTAALFFSMGNQEDRARNLFIGQPAFVVLDDADLDVSAQRDTVNVKIVSRYKVEEDVEEEAPSTIAELLEEEEEKYRIRDELTLKMEELGESDIVRSGRFGGQFELALYRAGQPVDRGDDLLLCLEDDEVVASFTDEIHGAGEFPRDVMDVAKVAGELDTAPRASQSVVLDETVKARKNVVEATAFLELGKIFKDMGLMDGARMKGAEGLERAEMVIRSEAQIPSDLREQAFKLKWELHLLREEFTAAIATCEAFSRIYPNSPFVDQALLGIGQVKMNAGEYAEAINIFNRVLRLPASLAKAEAQFRIAEATEESDSIEAAIPQYKTCAERYPDSAFAGPSVGKMIDYHIETRDYAQASELLDRVFQDYPDASFLDAMLLKWVLVAYRMGDFRKAHDKCSQLLFEYPGSSYASKAKSILPKIEAKL